MCADDKSSTVLAQNAAQCFQSFISPCLVLSGALTGSLSQLVISILQESELNPIQELLKLSLSVVLMGSMSKGIVIQPELCDNSTLHELSVTEA